MAIDGRVRARLLGLPLLDLDMHVVVTPAGFRARPALPRGGVTQRAADDDRHAARRPVAGRPRPALVPSPLPGLARAEHLLAEGAQLLDEAGRIH